MKNKNTTVVIIPKYNRKIVERGKMDTTNTHTSPEKQSIRVPAFVKKKSHDLYLNIFYLR